MEQETVAARGTWFRCVALRRDPLSTVGSSLAGGRFNQAGIGALYLAATPAVAVAEHLRLGSLYGVAAFPPRMLVTIEIALTDVLDLTEADVRASRGIDLQDLITEWRAADAPATQALGRSTRAVGVEGILFPSSIDPSVSNLVVFVENLRASSSVAVVGLSEDQKP
jgi:RES domain-containing protein